jgi:hypothetical protein
MNVEQFGSLLRNLGDNIEGGSMEEPLRATLPLLHQGVEDNFLRAQDSDGIPWPRRKDNKPHPLLILHGPLIEAARDTGNPGNIHEVSADGRLLTTGVDGDVVKYAARHQEGRGNMPKREFYYASDETVDRMEEAFVGSKPLEAMLA